MKSSNTFFVHFGLWELSLNIEIEVKGTAIQRDLTLPPYFFATTLGLWCRHNKIKSSIAYMKHFQLQHSVSSHRFEFANVTSPFALSRAMLVQRNRGSRMCCIILDGITLYKTLKISKPFGLIWGSNSSLLLYLNYAFTVLTSRHLFIGQKMWGFHWPIWIMISKEHSCIIFICMCVL